MNSRREAIFILTRWLETRDFPDRMMTEGADHAFVMDLVYTAIRRYRTLAWVLEQLVASMPKGETGAALLIGAAQILYMPDVADYAAVNETVEAAKLASKRAAGLVNGVLRNLLRKREELPALLASAPLGVRVSHPDALLTRWIERWGEVETQALCEWNNQAAQTYLAWRPGSAEAFTTLPRGMRVEQAEGYAEGAFIVQDPATAIAIRLMDLTAGLRVLDACAAPGGKTIQMAWRMGVPQQGEHRLVALDLHEDRLDVLRENLRRTKQTWVEVVQGDLSAGQGSTLTSLGVFDRILIDAPCSNTGVLRRRPDARWRWSTKRMKKLCEMQSALLTSALERLAPGGRIVYSTCSLEPEENRRQIAALRRAHPDVVCVGVEECLPTRTQTDGAFACALERAGSVDRTSCVPNDF